MHGYRDSFRNLTHADFFFLLHFASLSDQISSLCIKESKFLPVSVLRESPCFWPLLPQAGCSLLPRILPRNCSAGQFTRPRSFFELLTMLLFWLLASSHTHCWCVYTSISRALSHPSISLTIIPISCLQSLAHHNSILKTHVHGLFLLSSKEAYDDSTQSPSRKI